jgi:hypothetical protein
VKLSSENQNKFILNELNRIWELENSP